MFRILIKAVGKAQDHWHQQAIHSYELRLRPFARLEVLEIEGGHEKSAKPDVLKAQIAERDRLLKNLPSDAFVVALDEIGKELASADFSKSLDVWGANGRTVVFLIGGSWGLHPEVRARANAVLSLGRMTLPHLLARIVLLEQIYRSMTILQGKEYHK